VKRKPWWLRAIMIQEVGLIVVIALMVLGLTLATDNISRPEFQQVPRGQTATVTADAVTYTNAAGEAVRLTRADGWVLVQRGVMQRVERKEIVPIPAGGSAETVTDAQGTPTGFVVGGKTYLTANGWSIGQVPEAWGGGTQLQRDPQVNKFLNRDNLMIVLTSASFYAIMAVGLTAIIVLGGIDLSVGAIYALAAVCGAYVLSSMQAGAAAAGQEVGTGLALVIGIGVCCLVGLACGLLNGAASVGLGVHPFIITLGGMGVYRGLAFVTTGGLSIGDLPKGYGETVRHRIGGIEWVPASVMVVIGLLGALVFSRTVFGRRVFAIGGNETAAKYAGVPVGRTKIVVFMLAGLLAGLAAAIALGKYGSASSADGRGYELEVIAAAVVGGASLAGGRGSAMGAILGAIIIQLINNGFESLGIDSNYKQIVIGLSIVLAVLVDQTKNRLGGPRKH
jgi:ribose transport system permease protein